MSFFDTPEDDRNASPPRDDDGPRRMHADTCARWPGFFGWEILPEDARERKRECYHFAHAEGRQAERGAIGEKVRELSGKMRELSQQLGTLERAPKLTVSDGYRATADFCASLARELEAQLKELWRCVLAKGHDGLHTHPHEGYERTGAYEQWGDEKAPDRAAADGPADEDLLRIYATAANSMASRDGGVTLGNRALYDAGFAAGRSRIVELEDAIIKVRNEVIGAGPFREGVLKRIDKLTLDSLTPAHRPDATPAVDGQDGGK